MTSFTKGGEAIEFQEHMEKLGIKLDCNLDDLQKISMSEPAKCVSFHFQLHCSASLVRHTMSLTHIYTTRVTGYDAFRKYGEGRRAVRYGCFFPCVTFEMTGFWLRFGGAGPGSCVVVGWGAVKGSF